MENANPEAAPTQVAGSGPSKNTNASTTCEHEKTITELTEANKKLAEGNRQLEAELKAKPPAPSPDIIGSVQAELKTLKAENETLKAWKQAQEEADHMKLVEDVVNRRVKTGLLDAKSVQAAVDSLKKLPDDMLEVMRADLETLQGKFDSLPSGPKARLIPSATARFDPMQPTIGDLVGKKPGEK